MLITYDYFVIIVRIVSCLIIDVVHIFCIYIVNVCFVSDILCTLKG